MKIGQDLQKAGFSDHINTLTLVINAYIVYTCFVDFHKSFYTVIHQGIKLKPFQYHLNDLFYKIYTCNIQYVETELYLNKN